jgi:hypothetical protein
MKRLFVLLAALAATSAIVAGGALAGGNGTTTANCNSGNGYTLYGSSANLDIPAGMFCYLYGEYQGVVSVEGYAAPAAATFDKNVNVNGGTIVAVNGTTEFKGNLNITGSHGVPGVIGANGFVTDWGTVAIDGNLNYFGNFVPLIVGHTANVKGTFNYSGNTYPWDASQPLNVTGSSTIS